MKIKVLRKNALNKVLHEKYNGISVNDSNEIVVASHSIANISEVVSFIEGWNAQVDSLLPNRENVAFNKPVTVTISGGIGKTIIANAIISLVTANNDGLHRIGNFTYSNHERIRIHNVKGDT